MIVNHFLCFFKYVIYLFNESSRTYFFNCYVVRVNASNLFPQPAISQACSFFLNLESSEQGKINTAPDASINNDIFTIA
jgi:hypothetical protein